METSWTDLRPFSRESRSGAQWISVVTTRCSRSSDGGDGARHGSVPHRSLKGIEPGRLKSAELLDVFGLLRSQGRLDDVVDGGPARVAELLRDRVVCPSLRAQIQHARTPGAGQRTVAMASTDAWYGSDAHDPSVGRQARDPQDHWGGSAASVRIIALRASSQEGRGLRSVQWCPAAGCCQRWREGARRLSAHGPRTPWRAPLMTAVLERRPLYRRPAEIGRRVVFFLLEFGIEGLWGGRRGERRAQRCGDRAREGLRRAERDTQPGGALPPGEVRGRASGASPGRLGLRPRTCTGSAAA